MLTSVVEVSLCFCCIKFSQESLCEANTICDTGKKNKVVKIRSSYKKVAAPALTSCLSSVSIYSP